MPRNYGYSYGYHEDSWRDKLPSDSAMIKVGVGMVIALLLLFLVVLPIVDPLSGTKLMNTITLAGMDILLWVTLIVSGSVAAYAFYRKSIFGGVAATLVAVLTIGGMVGYWMTDNYREDKKYLATGAVVMADENAPLPGEFGIRAPQQIAAGTVNDSLGSTQGEPMNMKYLGADSRYSSFVERKMTMFGWSNTGYTSVVEQVYDEKGVRSGTEQCYFSDEANDYLGGPWWHSMEREISSIDRSLTVESKDVWGYCDGETPKLVIPVFDRTGFFTPVMEPRGVVIYDGSTETFEHKTEIKADELPGPSVSITYSEKLNRALHALNANGVLEYNKGATGLTSEVKSQDDTNVANASNFGLRNTELGNVYVTPFTYRSATENVSYLGLMNANGTEGENAQKTVVYKLTPTMQSNAYLSSEIRTRFENIPWPSGLSIQEIVPQSDKVWVATIGNNKAVSYRVTITVTASETDPETPRYGYKLERISEDGNATPVAEGESGGESTEVVGGMNFTDMSEEELLQAIEDSAQVITDASAELATR